MESAVEAKLMWEAIKPYLHKLSPKECEVMICLYIDRLSIADTATKLKIKPDTVSTHKHNARRKTRGACQLLRVGQSRSPVRPLCNRKRFSCLPPQSKMSWILYAISMRLSGYTSTRSISSSASSVVSVSASKIALDASLRLSCRACSSCFCFACANTAA